MAAAKTPVVHVISDSLGDTACEVVLAAAAQFDEGSFELARLPKVSGIEQVERYLHPRIDQAERMAVFYTFVDVGLRAQVADLLARLHIPGVDLMGPATGVLSVLTGCAPRAIPGAIHRTDERYFRRIDAMEYFVAHDDGRGADDLSEADIVLLGVSRTSKTPLAMYLAYLGYRVANVPLALGIEPPESIFSIDPARVFGLLSTTDVVASIRDRRLGTGLARSVASSYADPVTVEREIAESHALMKRLGCSIVRTDRKAIEESAAEIIARIEAVERGRARRSQTL